MLGKLKAAGKEEDQVGTSLQALQGVVGDRRRGHDSLTESPGVRADATAWDTQRRCFVEMERCSLSLYRASQYYQAVFFPD